MEANLKRCIGHLAHNQNGLHLIKNAEYIAQYHNSRISWNKSKSMQAVLFWIHLWQPFNTVQCSVLTLQKGTSKHSCSCRIYPFNRNILKLAPPLGHVPSLWLLIASGYPFLILIGGFFQSDCHNALNHSCIRNTCHVFLAFLQTTSIKKKK